MSQTITTTAATSAAPASIGRALLAVCSGAIVGLLLGALVYLASDDLATVLHQPHPSGYGVPVIVCSLYALAGAGIASIMLPRLSAPRC